MRGLDVKRSITLLTVTLLFLSVLLSALGCGDNNKELETYIAQADESFKKQNQLAQELEELEKKISLDLESPKTIKQSYDLYNQIIKKLEAINNENNEYINNLEKAEKIVTGKMKKHIGMELKAARKKTKVLEERIKIQNVYLEIWNSRAKTGNLLPFSTILFPP